MSVEITEAYLSKIAGWEAMKRARALFENGHVLSSAWTPPMLRGVVQEGTTSYRGGLVIKSPTDVENVCHCRAAQEWGTICAHSVAVGLHYVRSQATPVPGVAAGAKPDRSAKLSGGMPKQATGLKRDPDAGEPLEIAVVFPPNLDQALARGKVMLCFEGHWRSGKGPLNSLPKSQSFRLSPVDAGLLDRIEQFAGGETPGMLLLETKDLVALLPLLVDHPRLTAGKSSSVQVTATPFRIQLRATLDADGAIVLSLPGTGLAGRLLEGGWIFREGQFQPLGLPISYAAALNSPLRLSRAQVPQFLHQDWPRLAGACDVEANFRPEDFAVVSRPPRFLLHLTGGLSRLTARLECAYADRVLTPGEGGDSTWMPDPASPTRYLARDLNAERSAIGTLLQAGFKASDPQGNFLLLGQNEVLNFLARVYPRLEKTWEITLEERLERSTQQNIERLAPQFQIVSSGVEWFDLKVDYHTATGEVVPPSEIQRLLLSGQGHTRLRNGKIVVLDTGAVEELQEVLRDCAPEQHSGGYRIANAQAAFLGSTLSEQGWSTLAPSHWLERAREQSGSEDLICPPLGPLEDVLRPYQKRGVAWLHFLRRHGFGGILADEMGLGKTLQSLAFLQTTREPTLEPGKGGATTTPRRHPALVVCPTSLVSNWVSESARFTPQLRVVALHGAGRHQLFATIPDSDLVVTSYALLRRDEQYRDFEFDTVILDEAQHIKNRQTQNAQAVKSVRAAHRVVLTGTPLENSVLDLWSIFDFLMPGYLGTAQDFRDRYELPIVRHKDQAAQVRLSRRLRPFLLRRLKKEVARDLPEKIEQVAFCELTEQQRGLYQQVLAASRKEVLEAGPEAIGRSRMVVLTALLRLRQICCDPRLLKIDDVAAGSGKVELFAELLEEVLDGGHRVLVFSQFVSMLTLLREQLDAEGIGYCYLDGSTLNRPEVIARFQNQPEIPVFLISLKAGGVGLNLTGADTVIHFDPWWNPAVEDQATDRAHRIGQTRIVTSYKLITRDTVEEKILQLQNRKREIFRAALDGEEQLAGALNWEEIQELLAS